MEDGGRLAPMAAELVDRLAILVVVRRFHGMGAADSRSLRLVMSVCNILFVELLMFLFDVFGGMSAVNSCNIFLLFFMALWAPISATLFMRAVLTLWHAFLFLGLRFFLFSSFCLVASTAFSCKKMF
jgi:Na+(H+)/acetate symporter ActP